MPKRFRVAVSRPRRAAKILDARLTWKPMANCLALCRRKSRWCRTRSVCSCRRGSECGFVLTHSTAKLPEVVVHVEVVAQTYPFQIASIPHIYACFCLHVAVMYPLTIL